MAWLVQQDGTSFIVQQDGTSRILLNGVAATPVVPGRLTPASVDNGSATLAGVIRRGIIATAIVIPALLAPVGRGAPEPDVLRGRIQTGYTVTTAPPTPTPALRVVPAQLDNVEPLRGRVSVGYSVDLPATPPTPALRLTSVTLEPAATTTARIATGYTTATTQTVRVAPVALEQPATSVSGRIGPVSTPATVDTGTGDTFRAGPVAGSSLAPPDTDTTVTGGTASDLAGPDVASTLAGPRAVTTLAPNDLETA